MAREALRKKAVSTGEKGIMKVRGGVIALFLAPATLFYTVLVIYPLVYNFYLSFLRIRAVEGTIVEQWVGLRHFERIFFDDPVFIQAAGNSLTWAVASALIEIPVGVLLAIVLSRLKFLVRFFRTAWFMPVLLSYVLLGQLWSWIYRGDIGLLNALLRAIGLGSLAQPWLGQTSTALGALIVVTAWHWVGFTMVLCLAAVSSIPSELDDAARIDGATGWRLTWDITLPLIRNTIATATILVFIGRMKIFDLVWVATRGGPLGATETVGTYIVQRAFFFGTLDQGYAAALSTVWFVAIMVVSVVLNRMLWSPERYEY
jgi:multiple sugar transport system permease protein/raffinose/stachyose/melibiose transport system permease protein